MTTIQARVDEKTKRKAQKILAHLGLDLSSAIHMYLIQIILHQGIPFQILTENGMTPKAEKELREAMKSAKRSRKSYHSAKEMFEDILGT